MSEALRPPAGHGHDGHAKAGGQPAMSADMAHDMGHSGTDLPAMVRDRRNRFWICLIFTVPIFIYAPMGRMFEPCALPSQVLSRQLDPSFSPADHIGVRHRIHGISRWGAD